MSDTAQSPASASSRLLLVADRPDDDSNRFAEACTAAGWTVERVADVYQAMGRLAVSAGGFARVVVDTRTLDAVEKRFMDLARRYFAAVAIHELGEFVRFDGHAPQPVEEPRRVTSAARGIEFAEPEPIDAEAPEAARGVEEPPTAPLERDDMPPDDGIPEGIDPIYADAGEDDAAAAPAPVAAGPRLAQPPPDEDDSAPPTEPSLHDAVRQRMMAGAGAEGIAIRPVRRIPPATRRATIEAQPSAPASGPSQFDNVAAPRDGPPLQGRAALTQEELDALLGDDSGTEGRP